MSVTWAQEFLISATRHFPVSRTTAAKLRAWPPFTFVGWNCIMVDEELAREALEPPSRHRANVSGS